jgi:hypothetical protein
MYLFDFNFTLIACDQTSVSPVIPVSSCSNTGPIQEGPYLEGVSEVKPTEIGLDPYCIPSASTILFYYLEITCQLWPIFVWTAAPRLVRDILLFKGIYTVVLEA